MLSTVLNIIIFEDCRNQWSMSRPLLGLILLNEKVRSIRQCNRQLTFTSKGTFGVQILCSVSTRKAFVGAEMHTPH